MVVWYIIKHSEIFNLSMFDRKFFDSVFCKRLNLLQNSIDFICKNCKYHLVIVFQ